MRDTYCNVLILHVTDALKNATANGIAQILGCRLGMNVTEVNGTVHALNTIGVTHHANWTKGSGTICSKGREVGLSRGEG